MPEVNQVTDSTNWPPSQTMRSPYRSGARSSERALRSDPAPFRDGNRVRFESGSEIPALGHSCRHLASDQERASQSKDKQRQRRLVSRGIQGLDAYGLFDVAWHEPHQ